MRRNGFTLVELLVCVGIIALLVGLMLPAVQRVRRAALRARCESGVRQLVLGCHGYESAGGRFPAMGDPATWPNGGRWQYDIAPHVEGYTLGWARVRFDCPAKDRWTGTRPSYAGSDFGQDGFLARSAVGRSAGQFPDGLSHTLAVAELWCDPAKPTLNQVTPAGYTSSSVRSTAGCPARDGTVPGTAFGFGGPHSGGVVCGFGDGSVRVVAFTVSPSVWRATGTRAGGEVVTE